MIGTASDTPIRDVSDTAFMIAAYRAIETARPDALFRDPLAERLAGERGQRILRSVSTRFVGQWTVAIRTVLIDEFLQAGLARGIDTVLNLGAGLDTRPYRLELPASLRWIEVDYPRTIELKESLIAEPPGCRLERVKLDLADLPARRRLLAEIGASSNQILVLTEGVVPYLSLEEASALADDLRALAGVRRWIVDYFSPETMRYRRTRAQRRLMQNAPFRFEPADWFGFFEEHGWRAVEVRYIAEEAQRLNRPIPLPLLWRVGMTLRWLLMSKARRAGLRKFAGYVLLEPCERGLGKVSRGGGL